MVGQRGSDGPSAPLPSPATWSLGTWSVAAALVGLVLYQLLVDVSVIAGSDDLVYTLVGVIGLGLVLLGWRRLMRYFDDHPGRPGEF